MRKRYGKDLPRHGFPDFRESARGRFFDRILYTGYGDETEGTRPEGLLKRLTKSPESRERERRRAVLDELFYPAERTSYGLYTEGGVLTCADESVETAYLGPEVTRIAASALRGHPNLRFIYIPDTVTEIGISAFADCKKLETVRLPAKLDAIAQMTFCGCENLRYIVWPEALSRVDCFAFMDCLSLKEIRLPDGTKETDPFAFLHCPLTQPVYDRAKTVLYCDPNPLRTHLAVPDSVKTVMPFALFLHGNLRSVDLGQGVEKICDSAFDGCTMLEEVRFPLSLTAIGRHAFSDCPRLKTAALPNADTKTEPDSFDPGTRVIPGANENDTEEGGFFDVPQRKG